jgi:nicotinate dehydrogenase subunit A
VYRPAVFPRRMGRSLVPKMAISITVNGQAHALEEDGSLPLIFALRNTLGLKGVRFGCGGEDCGACTVIVDGKLHYSCTVTLDAVAGRHVETVDGLIGQEANALRDAFVAERAGQCGYCLSGILVTAYSVLQESKRPSRADPAICADAAPTRAS